MAESDNAQIQLPGLVVTVPGPQEGIPVSVTDLQRLQRLATAMKKQGRYFEDLAWALSGISISSFLTWLPWQASYSQLAKTAHYRYAWVGPTLIIMGAAAGLIAIGSFIATRRSRNERNDEAKEVLAEVNLLLGPHASK